MIDVSSGTRAYLFDKVIHDIPNKKGEIIPHLFCFFVPNLFLNYTEIRLLEQYSKFFSASEVLLSIEGRLTFNSSKRRFIAISTSLNTSNKVSPKAEQPGKEHTLAIYPSSYLL